MCLLRTCLSFQSGFENNARVFLRSSLICIFEDRYSRKSPLLESVSCPSVSMRFSKLHAPTKLMFFGCTKREQRGAFYIFCFDSKTPLGPRLKLRLRRVRSSNCLGISSPDSLMIVSIVHKCLQNKRQNHLGGQFRNLVEAGRPARKFALGHVELISLILPESTPGFTPEKCSLFRTTLQTYVQTS